MSAFPTYTQLVSILEGTAIDAEIGPLIASLTSYIGEYNEYEERLGQAPTITKAEFATIKENLPKLAKALIPFIVADAAYTQDNFGENYSLFYAYTLVSNAEDLVIGHIPESIMSILKNLIEEDDDIIIPKVRDTGIPN